MGDRRQSFFRSLLSSATSASRRRPAARTAPATTTAPTAESKNAGQSTTTTSAAPPAAATTATATSPPQSEPQKAEESQPTPPPPPSTKEQTAAKKDLPPATLPSPLSPLPASPSRRIAQSKSPPQSSSPSKPSPRARPMLSSPSRAPSTSKTSSMPKKASEPHSPSRSPKQTSSNSTKGVKPSPPSKKSKSSSQEISTSYEAPTSTSDDKGTKPAASQTEENSQPKADIISADKTVVEKTFKHNEGGMKPSNSPALDNMITPAADHTTTMPAEKVESSSINEEHKPHVELSDKTEEIKEVKEVMPEANNESTNAESKKKMNEPLPPKSSHAAEIIEKVEVPKQDNTQTHRQEDTKEAAFAVCPDANSANTTYQPKKRGRIDATHNISDLPDGEQVPLHKDISDDISTFINRMPTGDPKNAIHDRHVSVITLAGENRGASMQTGSNSEAPVHIHRAYKSNPNENAKASSEREGSSEGKEFEDADAAEDQTEAYINNNVQGINNSILFHSSITERNPGVNMVVANVAKEAIQPTGKTSPTARKAEFNMARAEKLTYEPTVRRRCLRGLFLESSDSDAENPDKPRRHGCRVGCQQQSEKEDSTNPHTT